jgi:hypothetical protein
MLVIVPQPSARLQHSRNDLSHVYEEGPITERPPAPLPVAHLPPAPPTDYALRTTHSQLPWTFRPLIHHNFVTMAVPRCLNTKIHTFTPRISSRSSLLQPLSHRSTTTPTTFRFFSSSPANMTIKAWFDVEYTDAALDKARADAERSGGAVPPRKLPFLSSIIPRFRFRLLAGPPWLHCNAARRLSTSSTPCLSSSHPRYITNTFHLSQAGSYQLQPL